MKKHKFVVKVLTEVNDSFIREWEQLWDKAENANPFNSFDWFAMYKDDAKGVRIYTCYAGKELVGVLPLAQNTCFGVKVVCPLGHKYAVNTPFLVKVVRRDLLKNLLDMAVREENLYLPKINAKEVQILHKLYPHIFFSLISANPYIDFKEDPLRFLSKDNARKIEKRVGQYKSHLRLATYDSRDDLEKCLKMMIKIDLKSGKSLRAKDVFSKMEIVKTFKNFVKYCRKFIRIFFLYYDNLPIAYVFGFAFKNTYLDYQTSYLNEYRRFSPGKFIRICLLKDLCKDGFEMYDFCGGLATYKLEFAPEFYLQYNLYCSKNPFVMFWWRAINKARRLKQILFPEKYTRDHEFLFKTLS